MVASVSLDHRLFPKLRNVRPCFGAEGLSLRCTLLLPYRIRRAIARNHGGAVARDSRGRPRRRHKRFGRPLRHWNMGRWRRCEDGIGRGRVIVDNHALIFPSWTYESPLAGQSTREPPPNWAQVTWASVGIAINELRRKNTVTRRAIPPSMPNESASPSRYNGPPARPASAK